MNSARKQKTALQDTPAIHEKSLRWRCRRGMQELDFLLLAYLDKQYQHADQATQQAFAQLLQQPDDVLWDWLSGRVSSNDASLQSVIAGIRGR